MTETTWKGIRTSGEGIQQTEFVGIGWDLSAVIFDICTKNVESS